MAMKSEIRQFRVLTSVVLTGALFSACATAPVQPPAPISTGQPRTQPVPPPTQNPLPEPEPVVPVVKPKPVVSTSGYVTPPFMKSRNIKRVAVLLPFSHKSAAVREQASGLLAAVEMALFDQAGNDVLLIPKDTAGDARQAAGVTTEAINEGADVIIGPLFANSVRSSANTARVQDIPVIAFSNDRSAAGGGAYLMSFPPEEEVARVVDWAILNGITRFAFMGPSSTYSRRVETALRFETSRRGGAVIASEFYSPDNQAPVDEARRLSGRIKTVQGQGGGKVAVMIPDDGVQLRAVAPLLPYYGADLRRLQYIGTSLWDDPQIWREPVMEGAVFASPDPADTESFGKAFNSTYTSAAPASLASLGYDAAALAISFLSDGVVTADELEEA